MPRRQSRGGSAPQYDDYDERGGGGGRRQSRGDYYPESDNGMTDPRPQRRRRGGGGGPSGGYDDYAPMADPDFDPQPKKKGKAGKVILIFFFFIVVALLAAVGGAFGALTLAGNGTLKDEALAKFSLQRATDESEDNSNDKDSVAYWEDKGGCEGLMEALKDGRIKEFLSGESSDETSDDDSDDTSSSDSDTTSTGDQSGSDGSVVDPSTQLPVAADPYGAGTTAPSATPADGTAVDPTAMQQPGGMQQPPALNEAGQPVDQYGNVITNNPTPDPSMAPAA